VNKGEFMKIHIFCLLCIYTFVMSVLAFSQTKTYSDKDLFATYSSGHRFGGGSITLNENGTYNDASGDCTNEYNQSGEYVFEAGVLNFTISKYTTNSHDGLKIIDLLNPLQRQSFFHDTDKIEKNFKMVPIKWDDRIYLIYSGNVNEFCNAVNLGIEPRKTLSSEPYIGAFYLRDGDETKPVTGFPKVSDELISFFLNKPVDATITKVDLDSKIKTAFINKGNNNKLKVGMRLVINNQEPSPWSGAVIIEVFKSTAKISITEKVNIGDKVSTRFKFKQDYFSN
jgi:hypothetical protein